MEELIETIRIATTADATDDTRAAGAHACRTLLASFDAKAGQPLASSSSSPSVADAALTVPPAPTPTAHAAAHAIASVLRGMTPDQLLDLAIARLRAALPSGVEVARPQAVTFQLIPIKR